MALGSNVTRYDILFDKYDTINNLTITTEMIDKWLEANSSLIYFYAYIYHDKDTKVVNGNVIDKTPHYHLTLELENPKSDEKILNDMAMSFGCNKCLIQIRNGTKDWLDRVRYLTHSNDRDKDKHQYKLCEVTTNNLHLYHEYFNYIDYRCPTLYTFREACIECNSIWEVYMRIGIKNAKAYRQIIADTWWDTKAERNYRQTKDKEKVLQEALEVSK